MTNIVLTHNDLDGACSGHLAGIAFDTNIIKHTNYHDVMKNLERYRDDYGWVNLIITDLNILPEELQFAMKHFKTVKIFDHHPSTTKFEPLPAISNKFKLWFDETKSATSLIYNYMVEQGHEFTDIEKNFYKYVNIYDLWLINDKEFPYARMANDLFWDYGIAQFAQKLKLNGAFDIPDGLTKPELATCKKAFDTINLACQEAEWYNTDSHSTIVILSNEQKLAINHVATLMKSHTGIFYVVYYSGKFRCSTRVDAANKGNYMMGDWWQEFQKDSVLVTGAGGHADASGVTFVPEAELPFVLKEIERFDAWVFQRLADAPF